MSNQWTDMGIEIGLVKGRDEGNIQGRVSMAMRQLRRRFGEAPTDLSEAIAGLNSDQLDDLGDALLDFNSIADAQAWIARI